MGGYIGVFTKNELRPEIFDIVSRSKNYDLPAIVQTGGGYLLVQRIWPFDPQYWTVLEKIDAVESARNVDTTVKPQVITIDEDNNKESFKLVKVNPRKTLLFTGSFHQKEYALNQLLKLRKIGFTAYYLETQDGSGRPLYNVIAGEFSSLNDVVEAKARLKEKGYESFSPKK